MSRNNLLKLGRTRKYVHFSHFSLSNKPALRITWTWLETDDWGIPRMSANSHTHSASLLTRCRMRQRVASASAFENATTSLITTDIVMRLSVTASAKLRLVERSHQSHQSRHPPRITCGIDSAASCQIDPALAQRLGCSKEFCWWHSSAPLELSRAHQHKK